MIEMIEEFECVDFDSEVKFVVGVYYGLVVIGNVGMMECFEFVVLGDIVNIVSWLESVIWEIGCRGLVSLVFVDKVRLENYFEF